MTAFKSFTHGLIAFGILVSSSMINQALADQGPQPPLGNVSDEDDPGLAQIQQRLKDEQSRLSAANQTYEYKKGTTGSSTSTATSTVSSSVSGSVSEIDELNANPQLKAALAGVRAQLIRGDWTAAVATLEGLIRRNPSGITARRFYAYALYRMGNPESAIRQILAYTKVVPATAVDDYVLGTAYKAMGDTEGARDAFRDAIAKDPCMDSARTELVKTLVSLYAYDSAMTVITDAYKIDIDKHRGTAEDDYWYKLAVRVEAAKKSNSVTLPYMPNIQPPVP
ncbi:MAG TPA: tetratricopeptide repeat protein [Planktothrix sp.]|jgi:predicted Zn-dependent protease